MIRNKPVNKKVKTTAGVSRPMQRKALDPLKPATVARPAQGINRPDLGNGEQARWGLS
jgi:hypothetical protein